MEYEEEVINELADLIADGVTEDELIERGYTTELIEAAHIQYLMLYYF